VAAVSRIILSLSLLFILAVNAPVRAATDPDNREAVIALANRCLNLIENHQYVELAGLFRYPDYYSAKEREADRDNVAGNLKDMVGEFGAVDTISLFDGYAVIRDLGTGGGDRGYWQRHRQAYNVRFEAHFAGVGDGFVKVQLVADGGPLDVRSISFGLAADRPDVDTRMAAIKHNLLRARAARNKTPHPTGEGT
jgi:hypothetical protein